MGYTHEEHNEESTHKGKYLSKGISMGGRAELAYYPEEDECAKGKVGQHGRGNLTNNEVVHLSLSLGTRPKNEWNERVPNLKKRR